MQNETEGNIEEESLNGSFLTRGRRPEKTEFFFIEMNISCVQTGKFFIEMNVIHRNVCANWIKNFFWFFLMFPVLS